MFTLVPYVPCPTALSDIELLVIHDNTCVLCTLVASDLIVGGTHGERSLDENNKICRLRRDYSFVHDAKDRSVVTSPPAPI